MTGITIAEPRPPKVALGELLRAFAVIGLSSFGGGLSGWLYREIVERRRWLSEHDFLAGLWPRTEPNSVTF